MYGVTLWFQGQFSGLVSNLISSDICEKFTSVIMSVQSLPLLYVFLLSSRAPKSMDLWLNFNYCFLSFSLTWSSLEVKASKVTFSQFSTCEYKSCILVMGGYWLLNALTICQLSILAITFLDNLTVITKPWDFEIFLNARPCAAGKYKTLLSHFQPFSTNLRSEYPGVGEILIIKCLDELPIV